ncbi:mechanosensitive ion channel family protein [Evansella clarkii]|jgi:MscS family membrane protein|uniref:mechanosensitive ion channel family protein n=1 Tax=Evansella clarkii TaxID=79879 RepID=UPI000998C718|nr:mechanosensitive ion channel family protein [Evansella clarkii]
MNETDFEEILEEIEIAFTWTEFGIAVGIVILFLIFRKIFTTYLFKFILMFSRKAHADVLTNVLLAFERPLRAFFFIIGIYIALVYLPHGDNVMNLIGLIYRSLIVILVAWGLFNLTSPNSAVFTKVGKRFHVEADNILMPFLSKLLRFAIIAMALSIIAAEWGYNVSGFVAGLGLGGLAFALAAQDSLSNFFGGVVIITEKPFKIGDWVSTPSVEGTVEDISFRSTKIRTFSQALVTVPNSTLANEPITNWTKMGKREISINMGVTFSTPRENIKRAVERINDYLQDNPEIHQELIMVRFDKIEDSSLNIFVYCFTNTTAWTEFLEVKERVNHYILQVLEEEGVQIAFPSQSIYVENAGNIEGSAKKGLEG